MRARGRVRVPGNVADRVHVRERGPEALVDDDSVLDVRAGVLRQLDVRYHADADDREEALERPAVRRPCPRQEASVALELLELGLEQDLEFVCRPISVGSSLPSSCSVSP